MMPKTSVRPAEIRKSMIPNCRPFSVCSRNSVGLMTIKSLHALAGPTLDSTGRAVTARRTRCHQLLQRTLGRISIVVILEDALAQLKSWLTIIALHDLREVEILDRKVIGVVAEVAADRFEVRLLQSRQEGPLVLNFALN